MTLPSTIHEYLTAIESESTASVHKQFLQEAHTSNEKYHTFMRIYEPNNAQGEYAGKFKGLPIAIKDNIMLKDHITSCGSKILEDFKAPYTATCIQRLLEQGAWINGHTVMDEFAMGSSTENSAYGPSLNPHDTSRIPGGSSGGSAVAVASGAAVIALGTDTGGSVRQPAALCGVIGFKPTYGAISRYGLQAMGSSFDQVGIFGRQINDIQTIFDTIKGKDEHDMTTFPREEFLPINPKKQIVFGLPKQFFNEGLDPTIKNQLLKLCEDLKNSGHIVKEIDIQTLEEVVAIYYTLIPAEVATNLARFDGIRYGLQEDSSASPTLHDYLTSVRKQGLGEEVKRRILIGNYVLSSKNYEGSYIKAQKLRAQLSEEFHNVFSDIDCIIGPTVPCGAWKFGQNSDNPLQDYLSDIYTIPANLAGIPAISIPLGWLEEQGTRLPTSIQLMSKQKNENTLFHCAQIVQQFCAF